MNIEIDVKKGPVVFLGGMNAMPMMYALELREQGVEVLYFVDVPESDTLSRPENHFDSISYPYPSWIIEFILKSQILVALFPKFFSRKIKSTVFNIAGVEAQCYITNGFFTCLTPYISSDATKVIALSHGSDFHAWADTEKSSELSEDYSSKSIFKYLPRFISINFIQKIVERQYLGFSKSNKVVYFPRGFHDRGDEVIGKLEGAGVDVSARYDVSEIPIEGISRDYKERGDKLVIFSGVRFLYDSLGEGAASINKGNDIIIEGLAKYYFTNPNIEIHFVEKGPDVEKAKQMCLELGLNEVITWHKEMKFQNLLDLYERSDICFDQCGSHWIGAIGGYALYLGRPLIANEEVTTKSGFWPKENPICTAKTAVEVFERMLELESPAYHKKISRESIVFARDYFSPGAFIKNNFTIR